MAKDIVFQNSEVKIYFQSEPEICFLIENWVDKTSQKTKPIKIYLRDKQRKNLGVKNDLLAKALGWKTKVKLNVVDATVGLGRDLEHILSLGCNVVGIEQNPYLHKALQMAFPEVEFIHGSSEMILQKENINSLFSNGISDVIYLDPMFPEKKKSAAVGKESLLLQYLTDDMPDDADIQLFQAAAASTVKRLVVKRPLKTKPFESAKRKLSHSYEGKAVRYDVYI